ncbi:MAG: tetratricopeptide repeat protein, partial [Planctomycetota bacterium]
MSGLVAVVTLACFAPVLGAEFVAWDDGISIYKNPNLGGLSLDRLRWAFTDVDSTMRYIPLTLLSWSVTYDLWGLNPFGYHLGNWVLHGLSAALMVLVIRKLLRLGLAERGEAGADSSWVMVAAAVGALLWSLHPMRVEPVAWATGRAY